MHKNDWDLSKEDGGHSVEELMHRLMDQLLKIKTYQEQEAIGEPVDVSALFEEAEYRSRYLHEAMESGDPKLRQLGVDAFLIDSQIQGESAKKINQVEEVADEPSGAVLSARRVPEVIYVKHEETELEDQPTIENSADIDVLLQRSWPEMLMENDDASPETVHEEDSSTSEGVPEAHSIFESAETEDFADDNMLDQYEHDKLATDTQDTEAESDDEHHDQPLGTYGLVAVLALVIILLVTKTEEGGEEELIEEEQSAMQARLMPAAPKAAGLAYSQLPTLLPESSLDLLAQGILRIHGSHEVDVELMPLLAMNFLASKGATDIKLVSINSHDQIIQAHLPGRKAPITIEIESHESSTAFDDLGDHQASIGVVTRPINKSEIAKLLDRYGNLHSPAAEHIIGLDGLGVIVNRNNSIGALTMEQLAGLFSGSITDWSQVGGSPGPVNIHVREEKAGTWDAFKHFVLDRHSQRLAQIHTRYESDDMLSDSVASDVGGIGFVRFPHVRHASAVPIADAASTTPILPTHFRVETEEYPLSRRIYMYSSPRKHQAIIDEFIYFIASPEGQSIVKKVDFIPQTVTRVRPRHLAHVTPVYEAITEGAERLSLNFHFQPGHVDLDSKGVHDIPRLASFLAENPVKEVLLLGFTDNRGKPLRNQGLSAKRAELVAQRLQEFGFTTQTIRGLGESMPIASNKTEFGRNRNRRVEVWVK